MTLQAEDFGLAGDGETDNTPSLIALRNAVRGGADRVWRVDLDPGHYCYADNRWALFGDRSVVLDFNHSTVECFADSLLPLGAGPLVWDAEYPTPKMVANAVVPAGHLLAADVKAGDDVATLQTGDAFAFAPGDAVLVAGHNQQLNEAGSETWGWPPNLSVFEWKRVAERVDGQTLRFSDPFRSDYWTGWPDYPSAFFNAGRSYGAPRIWRCRHDDGRQVNRSLTIRNARFVPGRNRPAGTNTALPANGLHVRLEGCETVPGVDFWPTVAGRVELADTVLAQMEMDKLVERFRMRGGHILGGVGGGGAGVLDIAFRDMTFYGFVQGTPRSWSFDNCRFFGGVHLSAGLTNTPFALTGAASQT